MPHLVYVVRCSDDTLYTGYTVDIVARLRLHNSGRGAKYTRSRSPVELVYAEELESRQDALRRELQIKKMSRSAKLLLCAGYRRSRGHSPRWSPRTN